MARTSTSELALPVGDAKPHRIIIRKPEVRIRTGLSDSHIWRLEARGDFPARIQLSPMAVGWDAGEVEQWIKSRPRANGKQPPLPQNRREAQPGKGGYRARRAPRGTLDH